MKNNLPLGKNLKGIQGQLDRLLEKGDFGTKWQALYEEQKRIENIIVERNLKGRELEKQGDTQSAIQLYEQNIADEVDTPHPYNRLAIIYRKQKRFDDEIRVIEKALKAYREIEQNKKWEGQLVKARENQKEQKAV